jgi:hypothetical protein
MLKGIRFEIPERERLVRNDVIREFDDLDIEPAFGSYLPDDVRDLGMRTGGDANANGFAPCRPRQREPLATIAAKIRISVSKTLNDVLTFARADSMPSAFYDLRRSHGLWNIRITKPARRNGHTFW